jgi:large subunit ribosomal protein L7Ae
MNLDRVMRDDNEVIMATYVKFETPQATADKALEAVEIAKATGKIRIGVNEVTKAVERGKAKLVVMAEDVDPQELMIHIPILCTEKKIPFAYSKTKDELGKAAGLKVNTTSIAIVDEGKAKKNIEDLAKELEKLINNG